MPDKKKNISFAATVSKRSVLYELLRQLVKAAFYLFYRRVSVSGREKVPGTSPVIFASNHQNALMDPLAIIVFTKRQPVFLARSDIFRNPLRARVLRFFRIMPVYRISDGVETLQENSEIFDFTARILRYGGSIGIMPEGTHGKRKRLRPLKKGIFRIALKAVEDNENLNLSIVPVGIDFSNHYLFREDITISFGNPLRISDYKLLYMDNAAKALGRMRSDLTASLSGLMIDIRNARHYERNKLILDIAVMVAIRTGKSGRSPRDRFDISRKVAAEINSTEKDPPGWFAELATLTDKLKSHLEENNLGHEVIEKSPGTVAIASRLAILILLFPVYVAGMVSHIIPLSIIHFVLKKITDPLFISSFKFVMGFFLVPANYLLIGIILSFYLPLSAVVLLIVALFLTGLVAAEYKKMYAGVLKFIAFVLKKRRQKSVIMEITSIYSGIRLLVLRLLENIRD